jgi:hypothetical protein
MTEDRRAPMESSFRTESQSSARRLGRILATGVVGYSRLNPRRRRGNGCFCEAASSCGNDRRVLFLAGDDPQRFLQQTALKLESLGGAGLLRLGLQTESAEMEIVGVARQA